MRSFLHRESFRSISSRYRAIFFDAFGVLNCGSGVLDGVPEALGWLRAEGKPYWLVTNDASLTPRQIAARYGGELFSEQQIVCSGLLAMEYMRRHLAGKNTAFLGTPDSEYYIRGAGNPVVPLSATEPGERPDVFVLTDEGGFDWRDGLTRVVNAFGHRPEVPLLAPNPDLLFLQKEGELGIGVGALSLMLEKILGRKVLRFGKPDPVIFNHALEKARVVLGKLSPREVLMVGDNLLTDIRGAAGCGMDSLLVLSGNTSAERMAGEIARAGIAPTYVADSIAG